MKQNTHFCQQGRGRFILLLLFCYCRGCVHFARHLERRLQVQIHFKQRKQSGGLLSNAWDKIKMQPSKSRCDAICWLWVAASELREYGKGEMWESGYHKSAGQLIGKGSLNRRTVSVWVVPLANSICDVTPRRTKQCTKRQLKLTFCF